MAKIKSKSKNHSKNKSNQLSPENIEQLALLAEQAAQKNHNLISIDKNDLDSELNQTENIVNLEPIQIKSKTNLNPKVILTDAPICTSFSPPLNLYELVALRYLAKKDDRSMRKTSSRLWREFIVMKAEQEGLTPEKAMEYIEEKEQGINSQFV